MSAAVQTPAAQYLRMSTQHQQYSLDNQRSAIKRYADQHGFTVVRTYKDAAKRGVYGSTDLVFDNCCETLSADSPVTRSSWFTTGAAGRFQDNDEGAHYEFLCKSAGNSLMEALKRSMASEYSRELGTKVLAGQRRLAELGFK